MDVNTALGILRKYVERAAYQEAATFAAHLPDGLGRNPSIALAWARMHMLQGRMNRASAVLEQADLANATAGQQLLLKLERAALYIYQDLAIRKALASAEEAWQSSIDQYIEPEIRAEAERINIRIKLLAATYFEIAPAVTYQALERLPELAKILRQTGWLDEALAASQTYAERLEVPDQRLESLDRLAVQAASEGRHSLAGEIRVARAEILLSLAAPKADIETELDNAAILFSLNQHCRGPIDIKRVRATLALEREFGGPDALKECLDAYLQLDDIRGVLSLALNLSQLAHNHGDVTSAINYRQQLLDLSESAGMSLARESAELAEIDILMRQADYGRAIETCEAALVASRLPFYSATYEQLLTSAYSLVSNYDEAQRYGRLAIDHLVALGVMDSASDAATQLGNVLNATRREAEWQESIHLLKDWNTQDERRQDWGRAVSKQELLAQIYINQFLYSPSRKGDTTLLAMAQASMETAKIAANKLPNSEAAKRLGALAQLQGQLLYIQNLPDASEQAWQTGLKIYERAGLAMEAANCRYIIGVMHLNAANQADLKANFGKAESNLNLALNYYEQTGMRERTADTRYMLARLYVNTASRVTANLGSQMIETALKHLTTAESNFDTIRRDFVAGSVIGAQQVKRTFAERSRKIYELGLQILLELNQSTEAWRWCQRAKARALSDTLSTSITPPTQILKEAAQYPKSYQLILQERDLATRVNSVAADQRLSLRCELEKLREQMALDLHLTNYLEVRTGGAIEPEEIENLLPADQAWVCVDWIAVGESLVMFVLRAGEAPQFVPMLTTMNTVHQFVSANLGPTTFRQTLLDAPDLLRELDPLIGPLGWLTKPDELLILSPTGAMHALPLHALKLNDTPLIIRNPVVYAPSLTNLRQCLARQRSITGSRTAALFGDPNGDRPEAAELVVNLARRFNASPKLGADVTQATFVRDISGRDLIHFQGHALHNFQQPLKSHLVLADGQFTVADVFTLSNLQAELIALAACESGANVIAVGDEPLGLIPAFLYAGSSSVLASLWRVNSASAALFMHHFYATLISRESMRTKAQAVQAATLAVADRYGWEAPYHWAPFVLHGDWR